MSSTAEDNNDPARLSVVEGGLADLSIEQELKLANDRIARLLRENQTLTKEREGLNRVISDITTSLSWQITAPLRAVMQRARRARDLLWPPFRFGSESPQLVVERDIEIQGSGEVGAKNPTFLIVGLNPVLEVRHADKTKSGWCGWHEISLRVESERSQQFFYLYYLRGATVSDRDRVLLPCIPGETFKLLFKLPHDVAGLRLQPFDVEGSFALPEFRIRQLGIAQVVASLFKRFVGPQLNNPAILLSKIRRGISILRAGGVTALKAKIFANQFVGDYSEWVKKYDTLSVSDLEQIEERIDVLDFKPKISVIMPVFNVAECWLVEAIESVIGQLYGNWELCIADDCSTAPHVREVLDRYAKRDSRIKIVYRELNGHIVEATNSALELADGEYVAFLDNDDLLTPHALYMVVEELNRDRSLKFIYSDEDKITAGGVRFNPYFKSDWNPTLILCQNYLCHLCVYSRDVVENVGNLRKGVEGAQDWDLALRVVDTIDASQIGHIPHILYHWRVIEGSTAQSTSFKPYVLNAQRRAVQDHLLRLGVDGAQVEIDEKMAQLRPILPLPKSQPLISLIVPTRDKVDYLRRTIDSIWKKTTYRNFEFIVIDNGSSEPETLEYFRYISETYGAKILRDESPFNYAALNNKAVKACTGEVLGFINNDLEVISSTWLEEMLSLLYFPGIGQVGAKLYYQNDTIQHAGVILGINGVAGHNHRGRPRHDPGYFNRAVLTQNLSGVTAACALVRRDVFERVGGFDQENLAVAFNDVDLSLKIRRAGFGVALAGSAELYHYESISRGYEVTPEKFMRFEREIETMKRRWGDLLSNDPYYNPNLSLVVEDFDYAFPPRAKKPWRAQ